MLSCFLTEASVEAEETFHFQRTCSTRWLRSLNRVGTLAKSNFPLVFTAVSAQCRTLEKRKGPTPKA
jgi:hypothetical protein